VFPKHRYNPFVCIVLPTNVLPTNGRLKIENKKQKHPKNTKNNYFLMSVASLYTPCFVMFCVFFVLISFGLIWTMLWLNKTIFNNKTFITHVCFKIKQKKYVKNDLIKIYSVIYCIQNKTNKKQNVNKSKKKVYNEWCSIKILFYQTSILLWKSLLLTRICRT